jgi:hypothetical protein
MDRRSFLRGLIAAPAIIPIRSLMPLRGMLLVPPYGRSPAMDVLPALAELEAMKSRWLSQWGEVAELLAVPPRFIRQMPALPPYSE